jgi:hypothetical protein
MPLSLLSRSQVAGGVEWVATKPSCFVCSQVFLCFVKSCFLWGYLVPLTYSPY